MLSMKTWSLHNLHHWLVYFALNFKPLRFTGQDIITGFYDTMEQGPVKVGPDSSRLESSLILTILR